MKKLFHKYVVCTIFGCRGEKVAVDKIDYYAPIYKIRCTNCA